MSHMNGTGSKHTAHDDVTVRWADARDMKEIERLAALDSKRLTSGRLLVAEAGGYIAAALPVDGGEPIADPFRPTRDLLDLLELRATQIAASGQSKGRGTAALWLSRTFLAGSRGESTPRAARPSLAGR